MDNKYIPLTKDEIIEMLNTIGVPDIKELFSDIPPNLILREELKLPKGMDEIKLFHLLKEKIKRCKIFKPNRVFLGGGATPIYVPAIVKSILLRSEFLTAYTPYQPEISQGVLQALFEYQSLISILTGLEVVNASMYDWASAAAEAILMSIRVTGNDTIYIIGDIGPERLQVIKTYLFPHNVKIKVIPFNKCSGLVDIDNLSKDNGKIACGYLEVPHFSGAIETELETIIEVIHKKGGLAIIGVDLWLLPIFRRLGDLGVDIIVGEGQVFGNPLFWGGPLLGVFAVRGDINLIRQMPGRIIGLSKTLEGELAYTMILQTREQHIRRERATSNICTNEALTAIAAAVYISSLGGKGLVNKAIKMLKLSHLLSQKLRELGLNAPPYNAPFFREFIIELPISPYRIIKYGLNHGIIFGCDVSNLYEPLYKNVMHISINDFHDRADIEHYIATLQEVI